jgi:hypothetical protein
LSFPYLSQVSGFATGLAGSTTVTAQTTSGSAAPATAGGASVGTVYEASTAGTYICLVTYTTGNLPLGTLPIVHWSVNGTAVDDPLPISAFQPLVSSPFKINTAAPVDFYLVSSLDHVSPVTGATITSQRAIAGGAFGATSGSVAEISNGCYRLSAAAADMNGTDIIFRFTATAADPVVIPINTSP